MERVRKGMWLKIEEERNGYIEAMKANRCQSGISSPVGKSSTCSLGVHVAACMMAECGLLQGPPSDLLLLC